MIDSFDGSAVVPGYLNPPPTPGNRRGKFNSDSAGILLTNIRVYFNFSHVGIQFKRFRCYEFITTIDIFVCACTGVARGTPLSKRSRRLGGINDIDPRKLEEAENCALLSRPVMFAYAYTTTEFLSCGCSGGDGILRT